MSEQVGDVKFALPVLASNSRKLWGVKGAGGDKVERKLKGRHVLKHFHNGGQH